jgi:CheY-like chemotaxis protein
MSHTVLVVEDEADVMLTFRIILETAGYVVIEASTGEDALTILETTVPAVMILDLRLPGIDGWQVLATVRQRGLLQDSPIMIASANAETEQRRRAAEFDCDEMFIKPFSAEKLLATLGRVLKPSSPNGSDKNSLAL